MRNLEDGRIGERGRNCVMRIRSEEKKMIVQSPEINKSSSAVVPGDSRRTSCDGDSIWIMWRMRSLV